MMGGDDYVIDENGAWGTPFAALAWYRQELARLKAAGLASEKQIRSHCAGICEQMKPWGNSADDHAAMLLQQAADRIKSGA